MITTREARLAAEAWMREEAGRHREALLPLLLVRAAVQGIIENDGGEEARASSRIGYRRLLAALEHPRHTRLRRLPADELRPVCVFRWSRRRRRG